MTKLVELLSEAFDEQPQVDKHEVVEGVRNFGAVGQSLFNNGNIMEVAQQLSKIAENAHTHILGEQGDWFDKVSVNKNMGILKNSVKEFKKTATEAHALNQRLQGLYEDMGHVLNRYYEIDEHLVNEKMDAVGQEDGDIDNDGDEDSSDEYLANRRKAIGKAMQNEEQLDEIVPFATAKPMMTQTIAKLSKKPVGKMAAAAAKKLGIMQSPGPKQSADKFVDGVKLPKAPDTLGPARPMKKESADARLLRLAGVTKEAVEAARPTKRLADIGSNVVTNKPVGRISKKL